jgi:hypothetical protein
MRLRLDALAREVKERKKRRSLADTAVMRGLSWLAETGKRLSLSAFMAVMRGLSWLAVTEKLLSVSALVFLKGKLEVLGRPRGTRGDELGSAVKNARLQGWCQLRDDFVPHSGLLLEVDIPEEGYREKSAKCHNCLSPIKVEIYSAEWNTRRARAEGWSESRESFKYLAAALAILSGIVLLREAFDQGGLLMAMLIGASSRPGGSSHCSRSCEAGA